MSREDLETTAAVDAPRCGADVLDDAEGDGEPQGDPSNAVFFLVLEPDALQPASGGHWLRGKLLPLWIVSIAAGLLSAAAGCDGSRAADGGADECDCRTADAANPDGGDGGADAEAGVDADGDGDGDAAEPRVRPLDLDDDVDNVWAWRRIRGSLDRETEVVFYWTGNIYPFVPRDPADFASPGAPDFEGALFRFEGFNVARFVEDPVDGFVMLSREASFYEDGSGEILQCWSNTLRSPSARVPVLHVWNDPVNFWVGPVEWVEHGDRLTFFSDIVLAYRSPLAGDERYTPYSASDVYQGGELFNFYVSRADLENENLDQVPVEISWTRIGQYLPWMQMGDAPGYLVYAARGWKLRNGVADLPEHLRDYVEASGRDEFLHAPETAPAGYTPNGTSWRTFEELFASGQYSPTCD